MKALMLAVLASFLFVSVGSSFEILGRDDEMRVIDFVGQTSAFTVKKYANPAAYAALLGITTRSLHTYDTFDVLMYYVPSSGTRGRTGYKYIDVVIHNINVFWSWLHHPHVPLHDYPDKLGDYTFYRSFGGDFSSLLLTGYSQPTGSHVDAAAIEAIDTNLQEMIDNARKAYGLTVYKPATKWSTCVAQSGGDWVYERLLDEDGGYHQKFYIARIDIEACKNIIKPSLSAAFRSQSRRRFSYDFDSNDMNVNIVVGPTGVRIDYDAKNVKITMTGSLAASQKVPRFGYVSIEKGDKWYVARILHRLHHASTNTLEWRVDPMSKSGVFVAGETVKLRVQQTPD